MRFLWTMLRHRSGADNGGCTHGVRMGSRGGVEREWSGVGAREDVRIGGVCIGVVGSNALQTSVRICFEYEHREEGGEGAVVMSEERRCGEFTEVRSFGNCNFSRFERGNCRMRMILYKA